jgi:hypothetical protein
MIEEQRLSPEHLQQLEVFGLVAQGPDTVPRECRRFVEIPSPACRFALKPLARNGFPCSRDRPNPPGSTHWKAVFWESRSIRRTTYLVAEMNYFRQICVFSTTNVTTPRIAVQSLCKGPRRNQQPFLLAALSAGRTRCCAQCVIAPPRDYCPSLPIWCARRETLRLAFLR